MLLKKPGFTAAAVLALALGIGANTAIFSVINALLLRPLPYPDADRLALVWEKDLKTGRQVSNNYADYLDWQQQTQSFEELAAAGDSDFTLYGNDAAERIDGEWVTANYFNALGILPVEGRAFLPDENATPGTHPVVILSHGLWQSRFGADRNLIGNTVNINGITLTVVGIMPEGFRGISGKSEVWIPFMMFEAANPILAQYKILSTRSTGWHMVIGRLKQGITPSQAQSEMDAIAERLGEQYPKTNATRGAMVRSAREELVGDLRPALLVLFGAVGFVLLIACANVANLFLVRMAARGKEMAIRVALGARRGRLIRQLLTESLLISLAGGALGLLLAYWGVKFLVVLIPVEIPSFFSVTIDGGVLAFTFAISIFTGVIFGLAPATGAVKPDLNESLKEGSRTVGASARVRNLRSLLAVAEIALALVLLVGAGLMLRSFQRIRQFDPGFNPENLLTMRFDVPSTKYSESEQAAIRHRVLERVASLPGVESAAISSHIFFGGGYLTGKNSVESSDVPTPDEGISTFQQYLSPNFFQTLGIPLLKGRDFTDQDNAESPKVAIIGQTFAERYWPGEDPIGKRIKPGRPDSNNGWIEIIGVVSDVKPRTRTTDANNFPQVYMPLAQWPGWRPALMVRTRTAPEKLVGSLRAAVQEISPDIPVYEIAAMHKLLADNSADTRFIALLMGLFAGLAVIMAAVGIYSVIAYSVSQRTREIGIRMALGAQRMDVLRLVVGQGIILALAGVGIGLGAALALTRVVASLLYEVSATDPTIFAVVSLGLTAVAFLASYIPARRAARVDPMVALRYE